MALGQTSDLKKINFADFYRTLGRSIYILQNISLFIWKESFHIQGDQLNMAVCFWCLVKHDLSSVLYSSVN